MGELNQGDRILRLAGGREVCVTPVYDTYWRFAAARQDVYARRLAGAPAPWTDDEIVASHRFTNAYRASDRVSQYLIRHVIYEGSDAPEDVVFRTLLFKVFNRIDTWELFVDRLAERPSWRTFDAKRYASILDAAMARGERIYSAAYIMPSPSFGHARKHRNHLELIEHMMHDGLVDRLRAATSLEEVYIILRGFRSLGNFLAFQFAIDLNYSEVLQFSEEDFVVAGPGARSGIEKCFSDTAGLDDAEIIQHMAEAADNEFARLGLEFKKLGGSRPLQLIDCQNLFCETDKYARVAHPTVTAGSGRSRIKQKFSASTEPLAAPIFPPKWGLGQAVVSRASSTRSKPRQASLSFAAAAEGM